MPRFRAGAPVVVFRSRNGGHFSQTYHSDAAAGAAVKGWKRAKGKIVRIQGAHQGKRNLPISRYKNILKNAGRKN